MLKYQKSKQQIYQQQVALREQSSSKKQSHSGKVDRKFVNEDDSSIPFASLIGSSRQEPNNHNKDKSNSQNSSFSSSPSLIQSKQRKQKLDMNLKSPNNPFKTQVMFGGSQSLNRNDGFSSGGGTFDHSSYAKPPIAFNQKKNTWQKTTFQPCSEDFNDHFKLTMAQHQALQSQRLNQFPTFEQSRQQQLQRQMYQSAGIGGGMQTENYQTNQTLNDKYVPITQITYGGDLVSLTQRTGESTTQSRFRNTPKSKTNGFAQSAPKIQDLQHQPRPKNLKDDSSDQESIDSQELNNPLVQQQQQPVIENKNMQQKVYSQSERVSLGVNFNIKRSSQQEVNDKVQDKQRGIHSPEFQISGMGNVANGISKVFSFNENKMMESRNANLQKLFSSSTNSTAQNKQSKKNFESIKSLTMQQQNIRSTSSGSRRAKWNINNQCSENNSFRKNYQEEEKPADTQRDDKQEKIQLLQQQYLAIKKQLLELQVTTKSSKRNHEDILSPEREIVGVLSPDDSQTSSNVDEGYDHDSDLKYSNQNRSSNKNHLLLVSNMSHQAKIKNSKKLRHENPGQFKSLDIKLEQNNVKQQISPPQLKYNNVKSAVKKAVHEDRQREENLLQKAQAMKSQLQIGIRKLSYKEQEREENKLKKKAQQMNGHSRKSSFRSKNRRFQTSQVSFVDCEQDCFSSASSHKYKDCFSGVKHQSKCKQSLISSGSSKYFLANDGESLCSCCKNELLDTIKHKKSRKKLEQWLSQKTLDKSKGNQKLHQTIDQHKEKRKHSRKKSQRFEDERTCRESIQDEKISCHKKSQKKLASNKKKHSSRESRRHKSKDERITDISHSKLNKNSFYNQQSQNAWLLSQSQAQQFPLNKIRQSLDQVNPLWPNPALQYAQNLQQPQVIIPGFQQAGYPMYNLNQGLIPQTVLQTQPLIAPQSIQIPLQITNTLPISRQSPKNQFYNNSNQQSTHQTLNPDLQVLENHKIQIEAIESLIKAAKQKLETSQGMTCKRDNQMGRYSRNEMMDRYSTYQSEASKKYQSQGMYEMEEKEHTRNNNSNFKDRYSTFMNQRRFSEQVELEQRNQRSPARESFDQSQDVYRQKGNIRKQIDNLGNHFNQSLSTIYGNEKHFGKNHQESLDRTNYASFDNRLKNDTKLQRIKEELKPKHKSSTKKLALKQKVEELTYYKEVDLSDEMLMNDRSRSQNTLVKNNQNQTGQRKLENLNQAIPEEREEDFHSPTPIQMPIATQESQNDQETHQYASVQKSQQKREAWVMDFALKENSPQKDLNPVNLAEAFKLKMGGSNIIEQKLSKKPKEKKEFTKQELFERKKELLKNARAKVQTQNVENPETQEGKRGDEVVITEKESQYNTKVLSVDISKVDNTIEVKSSKPPLLQKSNSKNENVAAQLMSRLSIGQKQEINKKDMLKLTTKNYEQLPEIKKKKMEEVKKEDLKKRMANVKELEKKRRESQAQKRAQKEKDLKSAQSHETSKQQ